jgi:hypothetical protein
MIGMVFGNSGTDFLELYRAGKDCITRLLDKNERTRLGSKSGASEVKQHKWFAKINWGLLRNMQPPVSGTKRAYRFFLFDLPLGASSEQTGLTHVARH